MVIDVYGMRRIMGLTTPGEDEQMQLAGAQDDLEAMARRVPAPQVAQPAPQPAPTPRGAPVRVQPGTAIQNYFNDRDKAMEELRRQQNGVRSAPVMAPRSDLGGEQVAAITGINGSLPEPLSPEEQERRRLNTSTGGIRG